MTATSFNPLSLSPQRSIFGRDSCIDGAAIQVRNSFPSLAAVDHSEKCKLERALKLQPDLIILDFVMPVMNGLDAARVLRLLMPAVPLILTSTDFDRLAEQEANVIGVPEILPKSGQMMIKKARQLLYSTHVRAAA
jgi:CheY-like chemotaxis protein